MRLSRGISRIFSFWGGFFLLVMMMPIAMCSDIVALFVSRFSQQQEEGHSEEEEEEEEHEDGALVRFASKASVRKRTTFSDDHVLIEFCERQQKWVFSRFVSLII